jgi:hypothetical protein
MLFCTRYLLDFKYYLGIFRDKGRFKLELRVMKSQEQCKLNCNPRLTSSTHCSCPRDLMQQLSSYTDVPQCQSSRRTMTHLVRTVFCDLTPCSKIKVYLCFGGICCRHLQGRIIIQAWDSASFVCPSKQKTNIFCDKASLLEWQCCVHFPSGVLLSSKAFREPLRPNRQLAQ